MKYKVGDRVRIKSIDWYNENKNNKGIVVCGSESFTHPMSHFCNEVVVIITIQDNCYRIFEDDGDWYWTDEMIEGLVERNGKTYPYKIGDRVVLKGNNRCATITDLKYNSWGNLSYYIKIDNDKDISIDYPTDLLLPYNKVEGFVEEESTNYSKVIDNGVSNPIIAKTSSSTIDTDKGFYSYSDSDDNLEMEWNLPQGYQFKDENGNVINATKIVLEKKKKEYPKTYKECCKVLGIEGNSLLISTKHITDYEKALWNLMGHLHGLIICRDAYWKIVGEEMGLDGPWEPDWKNDEQFKYIIICRRGCIIKDTYTAKNVILAFPTAEMRDAFYENFKGLIENCNELL